MFSLVKFTEDDVLSVVKSSDIGKKSRKLFAPFGGFKYPCDVILSGDRRSLEIYAAEIGVRKGRNLFLAKKEDVSSSMSFALVEFIDDGIQKIVRSNQIQTKRDIYFAPFRGVKYACKILKRSANREDLEKLLPLSLSDPKTELPEQGDGVGLLKEHLDNPTTTPPSSSDGPFLLEKQGVDEGPLEEHLRNPAEISLSPNEGPSSTSIPSSINKSPSHENQGDETGLTCKRKADDSAEDRDEDFKKIRLIVEDYLIDPSGALIPVNGMGGTDMLQVLESESFQSEIVLPVENHHDQHNVVEKIQSHEKPSHDPEYEPNEESDDNTDFDDDDIESDFDEGEFLNKMANQKNAETMGKSVEAIRSEDNDNPELYMSTANVFHSTILGENYRHDESSYRPSILQEEMLVSNDGAGTNPPIINHQFNQLDTGLCSKNIVLPRCSKDGAKRIRHYCILCKDDEEGNKTGKLSKDRRQANITRHWQVVHPRHRRIREINSAPSKLERNRLITRLRAEGDQYFNNVLAEKEGTLILSRRLTDNKEHGIQKYGDCAACGQKMMLKYLYQHNKRCFGKIHHGTSRILVQCSRATSLFIRPSAIQPLRNRIIPKLRFPDPITEAICEDEVIINFGNLQTVKYRESAHIDKMIRARLRRLSRFLIEVRKLSKTQHAINKDRFPIINNLSDVLKPAGVDIAKMAIENLANCTSVRGPDTYTNPTIATALRTLLKEVAEMYRNSCRKLNKIEEADDAMEFSRIFCFEFASEIGRLATTTQTKKTMRKDVILPTSKEIGQFFEYVSNIRDAAYAEVTKSRKEGERFPVQQWYQLAKASMVCLEVLNRRRPGDVEKIEIQDYQRIRQIDEESDEYKNLQEKDRTYADNYWTFSALAKLRRPVKLLVSTDLKKCLDAVVEYREQAQVSSLNTYLFGTFHPLEPNLRFLDAYQVMRNFAKKCGLGGPLGSERWRIIKATELRKQVATYAGVKKLNDYEISQTARFMGHTEAIHRGIYRQDQLLQLCVWMPQFLESAMGKDGEKDKKDKKKPQRKPWEAAQERNNENRTEKIDDISELQVCSMNDMEIDEIELPAVTAVDEQHIGSIIHNSSTSNPNTQMDTVPSQLRGPLKYVAWSQMELKLLFNHYRDLMLGNSKVLPSSKELAELIDKNRHIFHSSRKPASVKTRLSLFHKSKKRDLYLHGLA